MVALLVLAIPPLIAGNAEEPAASILIEDAEGLEASPAGFEAGSDDDDAFKAFLSSADKFGLDGAFPGSADSAAFCCAAISSAVRKRPPGPRGRRIACL